MCVPFSGRYSISGMEGFAGIQSPTSWCKYLKAKQATSKRCCWFARVSALIHCEKVCHMVPAMDDGSSSPGCCMVFQGRQHLQELWDSQLLLNVCEDLVVYPIILQGMQKRLQGVGPLVFEHILERCKAMLSPNPRSRGRCLRQAPPGQQFSSANKRGNLGWHQVKHWYWYGSNSTSNSRVRNAQMLLQFGTNHPNMGATDLTILTHPKSSQFFHRFLS